MIWRSAPGVESPASSEAAAGNASVIALHSLPEPPSQRSEPPPTPDVLGTRVELAPPQIRLDREPPRSQQSGRPAVQRGAEALLTRAVCSVEPVSDVEASAFAARFACDFQSFDEDVPWRRAEVLREVLADAQACTWGWSGAGRQRADSPLPGRIYRRSDTTVFVEVIVRATPYVRTAAAPDPDDCPEGEDSEWVEPPGTIGRSCAPAESDASWTACEPRWVRMTVPVTRAPEDGRLVVDPGLLTGPAGDQTGER
ncbi:hypothetical protein [Pseudonocardia sp. ICBG601]|uniref:hypothetical protein n=1 Tax=Pseudonocardia sp. ICBG601 TaxID=2846759 RepID=UPI001CF66BAB|nr:hypothetical protein [Pseudonocardia sp. ICBG601]